MTKKIKSNDYINYELEYLKLENQKLKEENKNLKKINIEKGLENDIEALIRISIRMKYLLEKCRTQLMIPIDLGKQIDQVIKEIENYN